MSTAPNGGGADDEYRVVYRAVADFVQLLTATRTARQEMQRLKADVQAIGGTQNVRVRVTADTVQARTEIARVVRDVVAKVKLTVDAVASRAEIQRVLGRLRATVELTADLSRLRQQIEAGVRRMVGHIDVRLNRTDVIAKMRALITFLQAMGPVRIKVAIDDSVFDKMAAIEERLAGIRDRLGEAGGAGGGGPPTPEAPYVGRHRSDEPKAEPKAPALPDLAPVVGLIAQISTVAAGAIPIVATLVGGISALGTAALAAGAGVGIFAVAAIGHLAKLTAALKESAKSGQPVPEAMRGVAAEVRGVKDTYNELLAATAVPVFGVFTKGLQLVQSLLPRLQPVINAVAAGMSAALDVVSGAVNSPGFSEFLAWVSERAPQAIVAFTTALTSIAGGLGSLLMAFDPLVDGFLDGFVRMTQAFADWAAGLGENQQFQAFLEYVREAAPVVVAFIGNLVAAGMNLIAALAPIGGVVLGLANALAVFIGWLDPAYVTTFIATLLALYVAFKVTSAIQKFTSALNTLFVVTRVQGLLASFAAAMPRFAAAMGVAATGALGLRGALVALTAATVIGAAITGLVLLFSSLTSSTDEATAATKGLTDAQTALASALESGGGKVDAAGRQQIAQALNDKELLEAGEAAGITVPEMVDAYIGGDDKWAEVVAKLKAREEFLKSTDVGSGQLVRVLPGGVPIYEGSKGRRGSQEQIDAATAGVKAAEAEAGAAEKAGDKYRRLAQARGADTEAAIDQAAAQLEVVDSLRKELAVALEDTPAQQANKGAFDAMKAADDATKAHKEALAGNSAAAKAAAQAVEDYADAQEQARDAAERSRDAEERLSEARERAKERLIDLKRELRDLPLDEEQARIGAEKSNQALQEAFNKGGVSDLDMRQLILDQKRASNNLGDFLEDKPGRKKKIGKEIAAGVEGNEGVKAANKALVRAREDEAKADEKVADAQQKVADTATAAKAELAELNEKMKAAQRAFTRAAGAAGMTEDQIRNLKRAMDKIEDKEFKVVANTKDAEEKLRALLRYEYALNLLAQPLNQGMTLEQALAQADKEIADQVPAKPDPRGKGGKGDPSGAAGRYLADGGAAGAVFGPGDGRSDSLRVRLPVGGDAALSTSEHIVTAGEVAAAGGHANIERWRQLMRSGSFISALGSGLRHALGGPTGGVPAAGSAGPRFTYAGLPRAGLPAYAGGGAAGGGGSQVTHNVDRGRTINVAVYNPTGQPAEVSLHRAVRQALEDF